MDSVTRLMTISVLLSMLTRVGCWVRLTAVTSIHIAIRVMKEESPSMASVSMVMVIGAVRRVLGNTGRVDTDNNMFHTPELIIRWFLVTALPSSDVLMRTWTMLAALMVAAQSRQRTTPMRYSVP